MRAAGFRQVASFNPYWEVRGCSFEDPDGYAWCCSAAATMTPDGTGRRLGPAPLRAFAGRERRNVLLQPH
jgi:hypothetical protein